MESLKFLKDEILALLELKEETLFEKIPKEKIVYYIREASRIGEKEGERYRDKDILSILKESKIQVINKESSPAKDFHLRGEIIFDRNEKKIIIYEDSINQMAKILKEFNLEKELIYKIHLAHEFYHFIEYSENKNTNELLDKLEVTILGRIKRKISLVKTREIAAHSFCKEVLNLKFHPKILDYIYLIKEERINLNSFKDYISHLEKTYSI